jgi:hypothetical protein
MDMTAPKQLGTHMDEAKRRLVAILAALPFLLQATAARSQSQPTPSAAHAPAEGRQEVRDPDGLYQFGKLIGHISGERIDKANNHVVYDAIRTQGQFDGGEDIEFREFVIHCDDAPGGPPPGLLIGNFIGTGSAGFCRLIGERPAR